MEDGKQLHGDAATFFLNDDHNMRTLLYAEYHEWQKVLYCSSSCMIAAWLPKEKYVKEKSK